MNVYGLIGYPLEHSFSKKYFTKKFGNEKRADCRFELFPLEAVSLLPELLNWQEGLKGLSVTIPYKETVMPYLSFIQQEAKEVGAVNSIKIKGQILSGYNTDIVGFERSFSPLLRSNHKKALVLGSGGASKAVQYVLRKLNIPYLIVSRRNQTHSDMISYSGLNEKIIREYPVIINTSPIGMFPDSSACPAIPYQFLNDKNFLFDLIYRPDTTRFLELGKAQGALIKNGYEMLIIQAEASWKIWNDLTLE
ncbi:MAG: shikimate dehydrogenase [Ferruginibacter sp.]